MGYHRGEATVGYDVLYDKRSCETIDSNNRRDG